MSADIELWRGAAAAWECDHLGHLNTRFYAAKVERALPPLIASPGGADRPLAAQHLRFHKEVRAGTPLHAVGRVTRWDEAGGELLISLVHSQGGELAATCRLLYGDRGRQSPDLPETARERDLMLTLRDLLDQIPPSASEADLISAKRAIKGMVKYARGREAQGARIASYVARGRRSAPPSLVNL